MSRQILEDEGNKKLVANRFGVATQDIPLATTTRLLNKIYVVTLSKYVATKSKNKLREQVATENKKLRQRSVTKIENSVATRLSMSRHNDQFGLEFWGSTMLLLK